jgi:hypothetical protein
LTVDEIVIGPDDDKTPVVNVAVVYLTLFAVVVYEAIAEPYASVGVTVTLNFERPLTGFPYVSEYPVVSVTATVHVGFTLAGIAQLIVFVFVPRLVFPLYVVNVKVTETLVPAVFWLASDTGGVKLTEVPVVFVVIVPEAEPHLYVIVCVKLLECLVMVNVCAVPNVPFPAVKLLLRGIVVSTFDAVAVTVPLLTPEV